MSEGSRTLLEYAYLIGILLLFGIAIGTGIRAMFGKGLQRKVLGVVIGGQFLTTFIFGFVLAVLIAVSTSIAWVGKTYEVWLDANIQMHFAYQFIVIAIILGLFISLFGVIRLNEYVMERLKRGLTPEEQEVWQKEYSDWPRWMAKIRDRLINRREETVR